MLYKVCKVTQEKESTLTFIFFSIICLNIYLNDLYLKYLHSLSIFQIIMDKKGWKPTCMQKKKICLNVYSGYISWKQYVTFKSELRANLAQTPQFPHIERKAREIKGFNEHHWKVSILHNIWNSHLSTGCLFQYFILALLFIAKPENAIWCQFLSYALIHKKKIKS